MTDIVPASTELAIPTDSAPPSFLRLAARMVRLVTAAMGLRDSMGDLQRRMILDAERGEHRADMCDVAEVEPRFTAKMRDASLLLREVATASGEVAQSVEEAAMAADDLRSEHQAEYGGIHEAANANPDVRQALPGFYRAR